VIVGFMIFSLTRRKKEKRKKKKKTCFDLLRDFENFKHICYDFIFRHWVWYMQNLIVSNHGHAIGLSFLRSFDPTSNISHTTWTFDVPFNRSRSKSNVCNNTFDVPVECFDHTQTFDIPFKHLSYRAFNVSLERLAFTEN